jgi:hypothetical protein
MMEMSVYCLGEAFTPTRENSKEIISGHGIN